MNICRQLSICLMILCAATTALAQHADVKPNVTDGRIVTDGWVDAASELVPGLRVFGYDFQEDPLDPYFASDPGFNTVGPSGIPPASQLRFNVLAGGSLGLPGNLSYWDGGGAVSFAPVPNGETLRLNLGGQNRTIGSALGEIAGFSIGTTGSNGSLHVHLNSFLQGSDGNSDPADGNSPADGIYLIPFELVSSSASVGDSLPLFLVYNNGLDEQIHDAAIGWVEEHLVPEPSSTLLAGLAAGLLVATRWRRNR